MLIFLIAYCQAFTVSPIPESGTPPSRSYQVSGLYNSQENTIITFGGYSLEDKAYSNSFNTFNFTSKTWGRVIPESVILPPGLASAHLYMRNDGNILVFFGEKAQGISSNVFSFNWHTLSWNLEKLSGDTIPGRRHYGYCSFDYDDRKYVALYGGITYKGVSNDLFIIDVESMNVTEMPKSGEVPGNKIGPSLSFYNGSLYLFGYTNADQNDGIQNSLYHYNLSTYLWEIVDISSSQKPEIRSMHYSAVYNNELYIFYGSVPELSLTRTSIWKLNFMTLEWKVISNIKDDYIAYPVWIQIDNMVYTVFGRDLVGGLNFITYIDLAEDQPKRKNLTQNWDSPPGRKNHCSFVVNEKMWIFGGKADNGEYLNDIWEYDLRKSLWNQIIPQGTIPSPRAMFSCALSRASYIVIYGGRDDSTVFDDMFFFDTIYNYWQQIGNSALSPPGRYGACAVVQGFYMVILGGANLEKNFNQIIMFDFLTDKFSSVLDKSDDSIGIIHHNCWLVEDQNLITLYVVGGRYDNYSPNNQIFKVGVNEDYGEFKSVTKAVFTSSILGVSESALVQMEDIVLLVSGTYWDYSISEKIIGFNFKTMSEFIVGSFPDVLAYGHSFAHYKNNLYIFGGGLKIDNFKIRYFALNNFYIIQPEKGEGDIIPCSAGTVPPDCQPCPQGYYCPEDDPIPCEPGTRSSLFSSKDSSQCLPCEYGSFSKKPGAIMCLQCSTYDYCPIGSQQPKDKVILKVFSESQPTEYEGKSEFINNIVNMLWIAVGVLCFIVTIIVSQSTVLWSWLKILDIYDDSHDQDTDVPVIFRKTELGGLFTTYYVLVFIVTVLGLTLSFVFDNILETKSLIPLITISDTITANSFIISSSFFNYLGSCVTDSKCPSSTVVEDAYADYTQKTVSCFDLGEACVVSVEYQEFYIENDASVTISMYETSSFASGIKVNITSSSSIPEQKSSISVPIYPESVDKVLKGRVPSIVNAEIIPSIFTSQSRKWPSYETGYHIALASEPIVGSQATQNTITRTGFVRVTVKMSATSNALVTRRDIINTWYIFLSSLLGAIFGVMETISSIMGYIEKIQLWFLDKKGEKEKLNKIKELHSNFKHIYRVSEINLKDSEG